MIKFPAEMNEVSELAVQTLDVGDRFAYVTPLSLVSPQPDRVQCGTVLHLGVGSVEVILDGERDTDRWALETPVIPTFSKEQEEEIKKMATQTQGQTTAKTTSKPQSQPAAQPSNLAGLKGSFLSRIGMQEKLLTQAIEKGDGEGQEKAAAKIEAIKAEAKAKGIDLTTKASAKANGAAPAPAQTAKPQPAAKPVQAAQSPAPKQAKSVQGADAAAKRTAALQAHRAAQPGAQPRVKKEPTLFPCLDGCGAMVKGNFTIGHDAKLKSLIQKVERAEASRDDIPEVAQGLVKFVKGETEKIKDTDGNVQVVQYLVCTAAPVKMPGRENFTVTARSQD